MNLRVLSRVSLGAVILEKLDHDTIGKTAVRALVDAIFTRKDGTGAVGMEK